MDMVKGMNLSKLFITGCDSKTEWMLEWFLLNYHKHNKTPLVVFDFGMTEKMKKQIDQLWKPSVFRPLNVSEQGWFKKPKAMIEGSKLANKVCWLDTDCHVQTNIEAIFDRVEPNRLAMVEDVPWSKRRGEKWHNSGVVAFQSRPNILDEWAAAVAANPRVGDQEVLHELVRRDMRRMIHITDLPREYNTLRLDLQDGTAPAKPRIMHWTGAKGKDVIRKMIND